MEGEAPFLKIHYTYERYDQENVEATEMGESRKRTFQLADL